MGSVNIHIGRRKRIFTFFTNVLKCRTQGAMKASFPASGIDTCEGNWRITWTMKVH
jgi:hypothetical protein